jgi:hydroxymethylpyrimidine/phosphomethylpyrimidine kinase
LEAQLRSVLEDISPGAVKIGMMGTADNARVVAKVLREYRVPNVVIDPVLASTSGMSLLEKEGHKILMAELFPLARLITPNIPEAEILCGFPIGNGQDAQRALETLYDKTGTSILLKGGHAPWNGDRSVDLFKEGDSIRALSARRIRGNRGHGTGCTLSSAIAAHLARGEDLFTALRRAKTYLTGALRSPLRIGGGLCPVDHGWKR